MNTDPEENELLALFAQGGKEAEKAFNLLVRKYGPSLYRQIRYIVRNHEETNDVLQNVLIKVFQKLDTFKRDSALYSWLFRIARNESLNYIKSEKLRQTRDLDQPYLELVAGHTNLQHITEERLINSFNRAIASLPEKQALVFQLKYFDDKKYHEIAAILKTSEGALKANYHHARMKIEHFLRDELNQY